MYTNYLKKTYSAYVVELGYQCNGDTSTLYTRYSGVFVINEVGDIQVSLQIYLQNPGIPAIRNYTILNYTHTHKKKFFINIRSPLPYGLPRACSKQYGRLHYGRYERSVKTRVGVLLIQCDRVGDSEDKASAIGSLHWVHFIYIPNNSLFTD